jgi:hypothetical protein
MIEDEAFPACVWKMAAKKSDTPPADAPSKKKYLIQKPHRIVSFAHF